MASNLDLPQICCFEPGSSVDCLGCLRHYGVPCCYHVSFLLACVYVRMYAWRADVHNELRVATFSRCFQLPAFSKNALLFIQKDKH